MLAVCVEFLHGTFRGDAAGTANTGRLTRGEWPPSPSRLFAALVAADGTEHRCRVTDGSELEWFERLPPPVIHASGSPHHQELQPRYVVEQKSSFAGKKRKGHEAEVHVHQEYVGRKGQLIRPGARVSPRRTQVVYRWDGESPAEATLDALRRRTARIGYLGAADSPVRVRVLTRMPETVFPEERFVPDPDGDAEIGVPAPGDLRNLDRMYEAWRMHGAAVGRSWFPALRHPARYRTPTSPPQARANGMVAAWLRLGEPVSGRRVSAVTALFKAAVLSKWQTLHGEPPAALHGHGFRANGYDLARFLALPNVGFPYSRGRIHGLALWMPPGADSVACRRAGDAARAVRRLTGAGMDVSVACSDVEKGPRATRPDRWLGPSRHWSTAFPAIHERRRPLDLAEVTRWCRHAGLPAPVWFRAGRTPFRPGAVDLAPVEVNRPDRPGLPYSHVELRFGHPVPGPVVVGAGRQRGFGLCIPIDDREGSSAQ